MINNPLYYSFQTGHGKEHSLNHFTVWGRKTVTVFRPWDFSRWLWGIYRVWSIICLTFLKKVKSFYVSSKGLTFFSPTVNLLTVGAYTVSSLRPVDLNLGNVTLLRWVSVGTDISYLSVFGRSAGVKIKVLRHRQGLTECLLPSSLIRWFSSDLLCMIGQQSYTSAKHLKLTKAGDSFWLGKKPRVRGVAMNPIDHPHGGGQGKTSGGRPSVTPWGKLTKGYKTRRKKQ